MQFKKDITDKYYKYIEDNFCCEISDELLGKKYFIAEKFGIGNFHRMKIEEGLDISKVNINEKMYMDFDNIGFKDNILELGYCFNGSVEITFPKKKYTLKKGDIFIYKILNNIDNFKFKYNKYVGVSINMNFNTIKSTVNPIWESRIVREWEYKTNNIFKEDILIIEKASYNIRRIAEELNNISSDDMIGYMKLKIKTIEFLATFLEEKSSISFLDKKNIYGEDIIIKVKNIINKNMENTPPIKEIAKLLNISLYKLQQVFKNTTGSTVYEYIQKIKIEKAIYLLENSDLTIIEIANTIGYENPSKFSALFKKYNNITPLKYKKNIKNL